MDYLQDLENDVFKTSRCYCDSTAFRRALDYIKTANLDLYATLLEIEAEECGIN